MAKTGPLARILRQAYNQAATVRGARQRAMLPKGLIIFIYITPGGEEHVRLGRVGRHPAVLEFQTVIKHWPHNRVPRNVTPKENREPGGHLFYLDASWVPLAEQPAPVQAGLPEGGTDA